jgi:hypothetical protein
MNFTLTDALAHYRAASETTHKFWGYYQVVAIGVAGFAWTQGDPQLQLFVWLSIAFLVFAVLSWRVVVHSQDEMFTAAKCVEAYLKTPETFVPDELRPIFDKVSPDTPEKVGVWHALLSVATLIAIWWRYALLC